MYKINSVGFCLFLACGVVLAVFSTKHNNKSTFHRFRRQSTDAEEDQCLLPSQPDNGRFSIDPKRCPPQLCTLKRGSLIPSGWDIFYECYVGYVLNTKTTTISCSNGRWSPEVPTCLVEKLCPPLKSQNVNVKCVYQANEVPCDLPMKYSTTATPECHPHYKPTHEPQNLTCLRNGQWDYPPLQCTPVCGISNTEILEVTDRIIDGKEAPLGSFPWQVGLYFRQETDEKVFWVQKCGGSLISEYYVLTATHCVRDVDEEDLRIAVGKYYRSWDRYEESEQKRNVTKITYHPEFHSPTLYFDIALLLVDKKIELGQFTMPVCNRLPDGRNYILNRKLFVAGWGRTRENDENSLSDTLRYTDVFYVPPNQCQNHIPSVYSLFDKFCTSKNNGAAVSVVQQGDSGGGLTVVYEGKHYIVGIVSLKMEGVTMFTNMLWPQHQSWIENEMRNYGDRDSKPVGSRKQGQEDWCMIPPPLAHGRYSPSTVFCDTSNSSPSSTCQNPGTLVAPTTVIYFSCHPGYALSTTHSIAVCVQSSWFPGLPTCTRCPQSLTISNGRSVCKGEIIFEDTFSGPLSDSWGYLVSMAQPNGLFEMNVIDKHNVFTSNGNLLIRPTVYNDTFVTQGTLNLKGCSPSKDCRRKATPVAILPPVATSWINTRYSFHFRYGEVEIRAKLPVGDFLAPEIWLEALQRTYYGPREASSVIQILSRGNSNLSCRGEDYGLGRVELWVSFGTFSNFRRKKLVLQNLTKEWHDSFHNFTIIWSPGTFSFKVDNTFVGEISPSGGKTLCEEFGFTQRECLIYSRGTKFAPFDKDFMISVGVLAGNRGYFGRDCTNRGKPMTWRTSSGQEGLLKFWQDRENWLPTWTEEGSALYIDYIRITAL